MPGVTQQYGDPEYAHDAPLSGTDAAAGKAG
eukprot:CAMPEP_0180391400 /NCGR_PEP_ID=MMETSP0989-20121125/32557_1 /TAXON_ID=697907 /ORGANISM="non described non described, Strain CCMP2293" /LENGTH=30 /DNA_ID= /DNA_START= /DNA_END= /DNA_ORIENTATION=